MSYFTSQSAERPLRKKFSTLLSLPFCFPEMGSSQIPVFSRKHHQNLSLSLLFLLISTWAPLIFTAEGRPIFRPIGGHSQEEKAMLRGQIGSRPPLCERRCSSCGHCEAIQVPTNPQIKNIGSRLNSSASNTMSTIDYGSSNYKPMSWKCKCGDSIFNP